MTIIKDTDGNSLIEYAYYNRLNRNGVIMSKNIQYLGLTYWFNEISRHVYSTEYALVFKICEDATIELNHNNGVEILLQRVKGVIEDYGTDDENEYISDTDSEIDGN